MIPGAIQCLPSLQRQSAQHLIWDSRIIHLRFLPYLRKIDFILIGEVLAFHFLLDYSLSRSQSIKPLTFQEDILTMFFSVFSRQGT